ncbi:all3515 family Zur-repressed PEP-CTERM protein [Capilliphycus salinus ALCB114379]|uniref:all3515 family Zur-repressed PEP-CTERM protein n=1 Tax=Capilliphycus salinus TaxID=2768948 RepID=UPI0039A4E56C
MFIGKSNWTTRLIFGSAVAVFTVINSSQITQAQISGGHADHHHLMVGVDGLETLDRDPFIGLPNPNYNRLSLLFPHQHDPIEVSHFHAIGVYSYTSPEDLTVIPTSSNNHVPEARYNLPPLPLFPGSEAFTGQYISMKTDEHMYSDLKTKPVAHLTDDLDDAYVNAIYNTGNGRWQGLLGENTTIALELVDLTPGLGIANSEGEDLFDAVGDNYIIIIGTGDYFSFTPTFYVAEDAAKMVYSATFRLLDVTTDSSSTPFLPSGTFTLNFQPVPEPSTLFALGTLSLMIFARRGKNSSN